MEQRLGDGLTTWYSNVFGYLRADPGARFLAKFPLVAGSSYPVNCSSGFERKVGAELLATLAPSLDKTIDMIILPDDTIRTLASLQTFIYCGR